jgi:uncharacterized membrane protein YphA (DoxX/SURF4 family)
MNPGDRTMAGSGLRDFGARRVAGGLWALLVLRLAIGWHLLYEGLSKWQAGDWSAGGFLRAADGPAAAFFHWIAATPAALTAANLATMWALMVLGVLLMLGIFTRLVSLAAGALLITFYLAGLSRASWSAEGAYLFVNKTLIEAVALWTLAMFPASAHIGLAHTLAALRRLIRRSRPKTADGPVYQERRAWLAGLVTLPFVGGFAYAYANDPRRGMPDGMSGATIQLTEVPLDQLAGSMPKGRIGDLEMSRLILGCNLIGGWAHARDLIYVSNLFKAYNTRDKVFETVWLAEQAGLDTMNVVSMQMPLIEEYKRVTGGRIKTVAQIMGNAETLREDIDRCIDAGVTTMYIQGAAGDRLVQGQRVDRLNELVEYMQRQGYQAGIGAHSIVTIQACEQAGLTPDYYVKTCHHDQYWSAHPRENRVEFSVDRERYLDHNMFHDNIFDLFPEQTVEVMHNVQKPWVAFKVLAGGALTPEDGFRYAFEAGADFLCVGMFDFQIVQDTNITIETLATLDGRQRAWYA